MGPLTPKGVCLAPALQDFCFVLLCFVNELQLKLKVTSLPFLQVYTVCNTPVPKSHFETVPLI